ncbi:MAG: hypothetical protein ACLFWF_10565 [Alphaproteobacteria bacterium]
MKRPFRVWLVLVAGFAVCDVIEVVTGFGQFNEHDLASHIFISVGFWAYHFLADALKKGGRE